MNQNQGIYVIIAAVAIQLVVGIAYIWSVFQNGIADSIFKGDNAGAALTFSLVLAMLAIGGIIGGKLTAKYSIRFVVLSGSLILSAGFFLASFVTSDYPWMLWITYGIIGGLGMGFTYSPSIACVQKWYPHKKGLVTGIVVAALGMGGVVFAPIANYLIAYFGGVGIGEPKTFMVLSGIVLVICTIGSMFMKTPPEGHMANAVSSSASTAAAPKSYTTAEMLKPPPEGHMANAVSSSASTAAASKSYTTAEMLKTPQFYLMTATLLLACIGGLMIIGFAKPIAEAKGLVEIAAIGVVVVSVANASGRLFWGAVSDKIGRMNTIFILLAGTAIFSLFVNMATGYWIFVVIALIGFFYGGTIGTFPSLTADFFGPKHMAINYGVVLLGFGVGAIISSQIAGYYKNVAATDISLMFPAFLIASLCAIGGIGLMLILRFVDKKSKSAAS